MRRSMKRGFLFVTALMVITVPLTACSSSNKGAGTNVSGENSSEKTTTFSMMYSDSAAYPFNKEWPALKQMQTLKNVKLDVQAVPDKDYANKFKIVTSSGTLPDLISSVDHPSLMSVAETGVLLNINDYLDKLPNFQKRVKEYKIDDELENWETKDGKLYILPQMNEAALYNTAPVIRTDLLKKYGLQVPKTMDELYNVLKVFKEKDPASYPMANLIGANTLRSISGAAWGIDPSYNGFMYDSASNSFTYAYTSDNYKQYVKYLNKLITEKLADPELYTSSLDSWKQKMATGKSTFTYTWISELAQLNADGKKNVGPDFELTPLPPIAGPGGVKAASTTRIKDGLVIPASAAKKPYFDKLLAFVDWLYSDEGNVPFTWGIKDQTYVEVNGKKDFSDAVKNSSSIQKSLWDIGAANTNYAMLYPYDWFIKVLNNPLVGTLTEEAKAKNWFPAITKVPKLKAEQKEEENMLVTTVNDLFAKTHEQFVYNKVNIDTEWNNYVKDMDARGVTKLKKIYNDSLAK
ncbi:extracellular solute-binding protein [Paenibacillus sp. CGMCC 1.16610]|uniref:Extracellular solute-binding protein n=1 Tax=Paenibacillus anseongense TaxID=2682845 RepID=A0ABW9U2M6_9BACL|nr:MULTISPECIES: extracellular solute-binding protein [Paenibacillus]MBA2936989.1 extracellular solute-binding protein [Paenibacillus sp. CGMCC 1.16610]MVQ33314.1 extracellular solute-binding protein [Paenibacillus anseongense]